MYISAPNIPLEYENTYKRIREAHKLYENHYLEVKKLLSYELSKSDRLFAAEAPWLARVSNLYWNIGTDLIGDDYCGNTILCSYYTSREKLHAKEDEKWFTTVGEIAGALTGWALDSNDSYYHINNAIKMSFKDYHFYSNCPLKVKNDLGLVLFSIICSVNYITKFLDRYIIEEIPQKLKLAYLQYYYLCDFIDDLNKEEKTSFHIDKSLKNSKFRNNLAHFGLGVDMKDEDIIDDDLLKGLTAKYFGLSYIDTKERIFNYLNDLVKQLEDYCL